MAPSWSSDVQYQTGIPHATNLSPSSRRTGPFGFVAATPKSSAVLGLDLSLFAAPSERQGTISSVDKKRWLANAYHLCALPQPAGLTAISWRRGGAAAAHHAGADQLLICGCAE
jgi:hypothetical protein